MNEDKKTYLMNEYRDCENRAMIKHFRKEKITISRLTETK